MRFSRAGLALFLAMSAVLSATISEANIERMPSVNSICVHERTVLRSKDGRSIRESTADDPVELAKVTVCDRERTACMVQGEEVPMTLCR
jgi:hypothetical protein